MGYDFTGSKPSIEEAVPLALQTILQSSLPSLNAHLQRDQYSMFLPPIQPDDVVIGNLDNSWDEMAGTKNITSLVKCCIDPGDYRSGLYSTTMERAYIDGSAGSNVFKQKFCTSIYLYIHPKAWTNYDPVFQARSKTVCQQRMLGWLRGGVFNFANPIYNGQGQLVSCLNVDIPLASFDYNDPTTTQSDHLTMCSLESSLVGIYSRGPGAGQTFIGVHGLHCGYVL